MGTHRKLLISTSLIMNEVIKFGEDVEGYDIPF